MLECFHEQSSRPTKPTKYASPCMINLDDSTLSRNICRRCTNKVKLVKKYRDFYLSVQAKLFIRRSNHFLRIDRQPLVQVILSQHETPRYIHPPNRLSRENGQQRRSSTDTFSSDSSDSASRSLNKRDFGKRSNSTTKQTGPQIIAGRRATQSPRSLSGNRTPAQSAISRHRTSPSPIVDGRPSSEVALPVTATWNSTTSSVDHKSDLSNRPPETEEFETIEQTQVSLSEDNRPMSAATENLELEVLETDMQSQGDTESFEDMTSLQEQENVDTKETIEMIAADNTHHNEFEDPEHLESDDKDAQYQVHATHGTDVFETTENTEGTDNAIDEKPIRHVTDTRRRRRSKISGRELYKSLLTDCHICGKKIERNRLEGHINRHSGRRPYGCPVEGCSSRFHCKHACRLHVRCRHGSETFACGTCGKEYKARRDLLGHIRETHVEPKFNCDICGKMFTTRSRLKQHRFYHTGERNFPCHVCAMRFFSNFQLKVHMRTHTKSFPYVCSVCNKSFRYRHMAKEHIVKDHGIDTTLQKDWVIQYPEPDPEEVEVVNTEKNIVRYNIQRLEESEEEDEMGESKEDVENSLTADQLAHHQELIDAE
uniref:C2H2-type domain-containing protein n=1 Tax=Anopheles culicifacies TaxID=139723 RepID=A0A182M1D1_9DIPT